MKKTTFLEKLCANVGAMLFQLQCVDMFGRFLAKDEQKSKPVSAWFPNTLKMSLHGN